MRLPLIFALMAACASLPAAAQDAVVATPDDEKHLDACVSEIEGRLDAQPSNNVSDCIGTASDACMAVPGGDTTIGMSACFQREAAWWDARLNGSYAELRDMLDAEAFAALQEAQRAWIVYRDADCGFVYQFWIDGTIRSPLHASCMMEATAERAIALDAILSWR